MLIAPLLKASKRYKNYVRFPKYFNGQDKFEFRDPVKNFIACKLSYLIERG